MNDRETSVMDAGVSQKNLSVVRYGKNDLRLEHHPVPEILKQNEVEVSIQYAGICGTDIHMWRSEIPDIPNAPSVLGHEASAIVTRLGPGVTSLAEGDKVALEAHVGCGACWKCKLGRYNICLTNVQGIPPTPTGYLTERMHHHSGFCHRLPNCVSLEEGALAEPLAVVVHACNRSKMRLGDSVLICGAGTIGLLTVMVAKASGAENICIIETNQSRAEFAAKLGADYVINTDNKTPKELASEIRNQMGQEPSLTFECSGNTCCTHTAIYATRPGGRIALVGIGPEIMDIPLNAAILKEVDLISVLGYANCFPTAINLIAERKVNVKCLVTHKFKLEDIMEAFSTVEKQEGMKVIIDMTR